MPTPRVSEEAKVKCQEKRESIRKYIREERDTILKRWMALEEAVANEDHNREKFYRDRTYQATRQVPSTIRKFLGSLRKSVRNTMKYKGGTAYSIVRNMFLYWDSEKCGMLKASDLHKCMKSLGVLINEAESKDVTDFYASRKAGYLDYRVLLDDLMRDEPTLLEVVESSRETDADRENRFASEEDKYMKKPQLIVNSPRRYLTPSSSL